MPKTNTAADQVYDWMTPRAGPPPRTSNGFPHQQLDQNSPVALRTALVARMSALPHVRLGTSVIAGNVAALHLDRAYAQGPAEAFTPDGGTEFAHLHTHHDGSLHMLLPLPAVAAAIAAGWADAHPAAAMGYINLVMIYGPRDDAELEIVARFVELSHAFASGHA